MTRRPETTPPATDGSAPNRADDGSAPRVLDPPRLTDGTELLGELEGSAFKESPHMARRADGQIVQLPPILYELARRLDGERQYDDLASQMTESLRRELEPDDVRFLVTEKLAPLGVVATDGGEAPQKADPLLALRLRTAVVPPRLVRALTTIFRPLFFPPVLIAALAGFVAFDVWLFSQHGIAQSVRAALYQPAVLLLLFGLVVLAATFHEFGHAAGTKYGGAEPGAMGVGIYIVWPAFYTDISESHRLGRGGRLRADLGGVYFHALFILALGGVFALTGYEPLLLVAVLLQVEMVRQMLPLLRFDGYYVVSDLVGIPDLFLRLKPILLSLVPGRGTHPKVAELKTWARIVVTVWVLLVIAAMAFYLSMMAVAAPRIVATAWDSFQTHLSRVQSSWSSGDTLRAVLSAIQLVALSLPALGITYTAIMFGRRFVRGWRALSGRPIARALLVTGALGLITLLAYLWAPREQYRPITPHERWTAAEITRAAASRSAIGRDVWQGDSDTATATPSADGGTHAVSDATTTPSPTRSPSASASATTSPSSSPSASPIWSASPTRSASASPSASTTTNARSSTSSSPTSTASASTSPTASAT